MPEVSFRFKLLSTPNKPEVLEVALMRSLRVQIEPRRDRENMIELKREKVGKDGWVEFALSESEIEALREGPKKVIYLAMSIEENGKPLLVTGTLLLAKIPELGDFAIDVKAGDLIPNYRDGELTLDPVKPKPVDGPEVPGDKEEKPPRGFTIGERTELAADFRDRTDHDLRHARAPRLLNSLEARRKNRGFIRKLMLETAARKRPRKQSGYVPPKTDPTAQLRDNVEAGLSRLKGKDWPGMALHLATDYLDGIGLKPGKDWSNLSEKEWEKLRSDLAIAPVAKRRNNLIETCRSQKKSDAAMRKIAGSNTADIIGASAAQPVIEGLSKPDLEAVYQQLCADLAAQIDIAKRPDMTDINAHVETTIAPGPADTTAYYDFHTLRVAWEDTWTSVYDDYTEKEVAKVYDEIVQKVGPDVAKVLENTEYVELLEFLDDLKQTVADSTEVSLSAAPAELVAWLPGVKKAWHYLADNERNYLMCLFQVAELDRKIEPIQSMPKHKLQMIANSISGNFSATYASTLPSNPAIDLSDWAEDKADNILDSVDYDDEEPQNFEFGRLGRMLDGIHKRLYSEPYTFDVFVEDSYNYGLIHTYQQRWTPLNYQVGDLISTMPLAPGEKKTYTVTEKRSTETNTTETSKRSMKSSSDQSSSMRSQADIVAKASFAASAATTINTNFGMKFKMFNGGVNTSTALNGSTSSDSQTTKQNIRESTMNAAQEYTDERSLEISAKSSDQTETITTSEISNPNNEITVTYMFYELQRRFEVSARLDKLTPVIMVAFEVPKPSEIDEDWLLTHDWILRKALLDPKLGAGLDYIRKGLTGDEISVEIYRAQWEIQASIVSELSANLKVHTRLRDLSRGALRNSSELVADKFDLGDAAQLAVGVPLPLIGGISGPLGVIASAVTGGLLAKDAISSDLTKDEIAAMQESARLGLEWANTDYQDAYNNVKEAVYALESATKAYADAIAGRQKMRTIVDQLRIHVKENILYYMQAIWAHEQPDQRYFRIYNNEVIWPKASGLPQIRLAGGTFSPATMPNMDLLRKFGAKDRITFELKHPVPQFGGTYPTQQLHEVADLDNLLGFKGNYAIFPIKQHNAVTNFMAQEFLDGYFGVRDPDPNGGIPTEAEALEIAECLWAKAGNDEDKRAFVVRWLTNVLDRQIFVSDEITVPSGQLFIEALPGAHPLLEDFKLRHRAVDLEKARQELINARVETIRKVKRLLSEDLSDPDIDKQIVIEGGSASVTVTED